MMTKDLFLEEALPMKPIPQTSQEQTDMDSGASEGYLGQAISPDAVSGASAI